MKSSALTKMGRPMNGERQEAVSSRVAGKFEPRSVEAGSSVNSSPDPWLRMYTEEEVSDLLRVSLSQLRKWRMKKNRHSVQGPPFRKLGRLVRYPGPGLQAYINGQEPHSEK